MKNFVHLLCWSLVAIVLFPSALLAQQDRVYVRRGAPTEGTITEMAPDKVVLDKGGNPQTFAANDVLKVVYGEEPTELGRARDSALSGQVEAALKELNQMNSMSLTRDEVRQELAYYKAYCEAKIGLSTGANLAVANESLLAFVKAYRGSFHMFEATELLGQVAVAQGDWENAAKYFAFLGRAPWPDYKMRAAVFEARALSSQKNYPAAIEKYDTVIGAQNSDPEAIRQKLLAKVGKAVCLSETNKPDEAIALAEDIIKNQDSKDVELFGRAYNALGRSYLKQKKTKEALLAFLHVDTLFFGDAEAHPEALFYLSRLWSEVQKADRAISARTTLQQRYGGSIWAKQL